VELYGTARSLQSEAKLLEISIQTLEFLQPKHSQNSEGPSSGQLALAETGRRTFLQHLEFDERPCPLGGINRACTAVYEASCRVTTSF